MRSPQLFERLAPNMDEPRDLPRTGISLNGAPSQYQRWLRSVAPDSVRVDDRSFAELLNFAVQYGRLVTFCDLNDQPDGDWTLFFLTDPTMILASVESLNLRALEKQFFASLRQALQDQQYDSKFEHLQECFRTIMILARQIDAWLGGAQINPRSRPARLFTGELATWIGAKLSPRLQQLKAHADGAALPEVLGQSLDLDFNRFAPLWNLKRVAPDASPGSGHSKPKNIDHIASRLEPIFHAFFEVLTHLKRFARKHLPETLMESHHKPYVALYIAFVHLFQIEQRALNKLTERFTRFYYGEILRETSAGPAPDSVYLMLTLDPAAGVDAFTVPAGTQFPAGKEEDGTTILYASDKEVSVSAAALASLRAIRVVAGHLYATAPSSPDWPDQQWHDSPPAVQAMQMVIGTEIDIDLMNDEAAGKGPPEGPIPWATFGETTAGSSEIATAAPVTLGFAMASPYLMLTGGDRTVTVSFQFQPGAWQILTPDLEVLAAAAGLDPVTVFEQVTAGAFNLYLSTTDGWFPVDAYSCTVFPSAAQPPSQFSLVFTLASSAPPIVAYNPAPDAPPPATPLVPDNLNPDPALPTLKAYLRQMPVLLTGANGDVTTYPLSLLSQVAIDWIEIGTATANLTNLVVENTTGAVDTSSPYPVFGGIPVTGSFIQFRNEELFVKTPNTGSLEVNLLWFGLPTNDDGFKGYYQGYVVGLDGQPSPTTLFDNQTFGGDLRVLNPGSWDIRTQAAPAASPPQPGVYLFRTVDGCSSPVPTTGGALCPVSTFDALEIFDTAPPPYYDPASSAVRLTLTEPSYAFGNVLYSPNVLNAVIAELPVPDTEEPSVPACQPLVDAADALGPLVRQGDQPPPSQSDIQTSVRQAQSRLLQAAQGYLAKSLSQYGEDAGSWIQQQFAVSGTPAPPYQAQTVRARLQASLAAIEQSGEGLSSPGMLPKGAAGAVLNAIAMLQPVVWMQQALDQCAGLLVPVKAAPPQGGLTPSSANAAWLQCVQTQLAACQQKLRQAYSACIVANQEPVSYPNLPWTPQAEGLSVSYSAHCGFSPTSTGQAGGNYYYLLPFGGYEAVTSAAPATLLLPVPGPGSLELGFSGLTTAQTVSMLVQMSAGSAVNPPEVEWQFLAANEWVSFDAAQIPVDTTNGLQNTGILTLNVPAADPVVQTAAPDGYRWLRAATQTPDEFPDTIGIYPHPLIATWVSDGGGSGQHLSQPLPPYTINSSVQNLAAIKTIDQPIESFGGQPAETDKTFQVRLAERLRHKDRAILPWDYEQLVLEQFPTVWKVQALPATSTQGVTAAGRALVVIVAGPDSIQLADPTEPLASADLLEQIRAYLVPLASPFAGIQVVNPVYVRIKVHAEVMFQDSEEGGGGVDELNSELVQYLSPWFYNAQRAADDGNYATRDAISQFIQTRPYVDVLIAIRFEYDPLPETLDWYFLTSAKSHSITEGSDNAG